MGNMEKAFIVFLWSYVGPSLDDVAYRETLGTQDPRELEGPWFNTICWRTGRVSSILISEIHVGPYGSQVI